MPDSSFSIKVIGISTTSPSSSVIASSPTVISYCCLVSVFGNSAANAVVFSENMIIIPTCGGEEKAAEPTGYSEEYLDAYSLHLYAYADAGIEKETAEEWAKKTCDLLIGK